MKKIKEFLKYLKNTSAVRGGKYLFYAVVAASAVLGTCAYFWNKYVMHMDISIF